MGDAGTKRCTESGKIRLDMVVHIILPVVRDDQFRLSFSDDFAQFIDQSVILCGDMDVRDVNGIMVCTDDFCRGFRLIESNLSKFPRQYLRMPHVSVCDMANRDGVPLFGVLCQCSVTAYFQVVRMAADREDFHSFLLFPE